MTIKPVRRSVLIEEHWNQVVHLRRRALHVFTHHCTIEFTDNRIDTGVSLYKAILCNLSKTHTALNRKLAGNNMSIDSMRAISLEASAVACHVWRRLHYLQPFVASAGHFCIHKVIRPCGHLQKEIRARSSGPLLGTRHLCTQSLSSRGADCGNRALCVTGFVAGCKSLGSRDPRRRSIQQFYQAYTHRRNQSLLRHHPRHHRVDRLWISLFL